MFKTAVVILSWNGFDWLKKFLGTVLNFSEDNETFVYVVDNGSTDGSYEWVTENYNNVRLIRFEKNFGFAGGYNRAIELIDSQYIVLLNSDVEVTRGWLEPLISHLDSHPDVASCQPKIKSLFEKDHFEYAGAAGGFIDKYGFTFCRGRIFNFVESDKGQYDRQIDIFWSSGACMAVRSDAWKKNGGFDDDFFAHMEEVDLCWRFHRAGLRVSCVPESVVYHAGGGALPYNSELKTFLNFRNNLYLLYKNLPYSKLHSTLLIRKILDGVAALIYLFTGRIKLVKAIWNAHIEYYKNIKTLKLKRDLFKEKYTDNPVIPVYNRSIVVGFYIKRKKTFGNMMAVK